jgi:hypothetical protein
MDIFRGHMCTEAHAHRIDDRRNAIRIVERARTESTRPRIRIVRAVSIDIATDARVGNDLVCTRFLIYEAIGFILIVDPDLRAARSTCNPDVIIFRLLFVGDRNENVDEIRKRILTSKNGRAYTARPH